MSCGCWPVCKFAVLIWSTFLQLFQPITHRIAKAMANTRYMAAIPALFDWPPKTRNKWNLTALIAESWTKKNPLRPFWPKMWWGRNTQFGPKTCRFFGERRRFVAVDVAVVAVAMLLLTYLDWKRLASLATNASRLFTPRAFPRLPSPRIPFPWIASIHSGCFTKEREPRLQNPNLFPTQLVGSVFSVMASANIIMNKTKSRHWWRNESKKLPDTCRRSSRLYLRTVLWRYSAQARPICSPSLKSPKSFKSSKSLKSKSFKSFKVT